jgi:hypothetical protein
MPNRKMFDKKNIEEHIGTDIKYRPSLDSLKEVEKYFIESCESRGIEWSHDCVAEESCYFKTINYTTFANLFVMNPLSTKFQEIQLREAAIDNLEPVGHMEWLISNIESNQQGKYVLPDDTAMRSDENIKAFTDLIILTGSNKYKDTMSHVKLDMLINTLGDKAVLKPHPLTNKGLMEHLNKIKGDAQLADKHSDLYSLVKKADKVHTLHTSESALMSLLMGKTITPIDRPDVSGGFVAFNSYCFNDETPIETLNSMFASHKSGVVHPDVDKDWKGKIDSYIEYALKKRSKQRGFYYEK